MTVLVGVFLPLTVGLGFWQLQRAQEKRGYQELFIARMSAQPAPPPADLSDVTFLRVRLTGEFEGERYFLVDNQMDAGRPGYWVVASFRAEDGRRWLVNRGWIAAAAARDVLPRVPVPKGRIETVGAFWPDTGLVPLLGPDPWPGPWPHRVQRLNVGRMARLLENAAPREIRLEAGQPGSLKALSVNVGFDHQRHNGYAVQWFGLAAVLVMGYTLLGFKR